MSNQRTSSHRSSRIGGDFNGRGADGASACAPALRVRWSFAARNSELVAWVRFEMFLKPAQRTRFAGALEFRYCETPRSSRGPGSEIFLSPTAHSLRGRETPRLLIGMDSGGFLNLYGAPPCGDAFELLCKSVPCGAAKRDSTLADGLRATGTGTASSRFAFRRIRGRSRSAPPRPAGGWQRMGLAWSTVPHRQFRASRGVLLYAGSPPPPQRTRHVCS